MNSSVPRVHVSTCTHTYTDSLSALICLLNEGKVWTDVFGEHLDNTQHAHFCPHSIMTYWGGRESKVERISWDEHSSSLHAELRHLCCCSSGRLKVFKQSDFQIQRVTFCLWPGIFGHWLLIVGHFIEHTNNECEYTGSEAFTGKDQIVWCDSKGLLGGTGPAKHLVYIS